MPPFSPVNSLPRRGESQPTAQQAEMLGHMQWFDDKTDSTDKSPRSRRGVLCMFVKNDSGGALLPGECVTFKAAGFGKTIGAKAGDGARAHGVVDHQLPAAGVADQRNFWITVYGPTQVINDGAAAIAQGDEVVTAAAGEVNEQTAAPADTTATMVQVKSRIGVCEEAVGASNVAFFANVNLL